MPNKPVCATSDKQSTHGAPAPKWTPTSSGGGGSSTIPSGSGGLQGGLKNTHPATGGNK